MNDRMDALPEEFKRILQDAGAASLESVADDIDKHGKDVYTKQEITSILKWTATYLKEGRK